LPPGKLRIDKANGLNADATLTTLDTADGITRCMGNLDLYRRLLKGFDKTHQDFGAQFVQAQRSKDAESALRLAHTLKGLAGNIGAMALQHTAAELERCCLEGPGAPVDAALMQTLSALSAVRVDIQALIQPNAAPTHAEDAHKLLHDQAIQGQWLKLSKLIEDNDAQAQTLIQDLVDGWPGLLQAPAVRELNQALGRYDFDAAGVALRTLLQQA
jgi:two-component system sensor histidine kinase/response regulator